MNHRINRRQFLKSASLISICAISTGAMISPATAIEPVTQPSTNPATLGVSLNTYSFNKLLLDDLLLPRLSQAAR
jgi:hypothetical protein